MVKKAPSTHDEDEALRARVRATGRSQASLSRDAQIGDSSLSAFMLGKGNSRLLGPIRERLVAVIDRTAPPSSDAPTRPPAQGESMDMFEELFTEWRSDIAQRERDIDALAKRATDAIEAWRVARREVLKHEVATRMGMKKPAPVGAGDAALAILAACEQIPDCLQAMREMREPAATADTPDTDEDMPPPPERAVPETASPTPEPPVSFPKLSAQALPMAIIGGQPSQEKLRWIREIVPRVEWIEMPANANGQSVLDRIGNRRFSGIVILSGMLHAGNAERVRTAAGAAKVPVTSASTAGSGQLRWAFQELESKLRNAS